jgi:GNAT superfamily N-acetyltransferase
MRIRPALAADGPAYIALVRALADFEKLPGPTDEAAARLLEDAFGPRPRYELTVADLDGDVCAYAVTFETYSTFLARPSLYLEDLFVHPRARRRGVATALLEHLRARARDRGCGRFEWMVLDWNVDAQQLYRRLGAARLDTGQLFRIPITV